MGLKNKKPPTQFAHRCSLMSVSEPGGLATVSLVALAVLTTVYLILDHGDAKAEEGGKKAETVEFCHRLSSSLFSVGHAECLERKLQPLGLRTKNGNVLVYKEYPPLDRRKPLGKVLLIGGTHGDEYSSYSVLIKWLTTLDKYHSGLFHWKVLPALNPDGLFAHPPTRNNSNGVDLNRSLPDIRETATNIVNSLPNALGKPFLPHEDRNDSNMEPEIKVLVNTIRNFMPDTIVSLHAPYGIVDYDGPLRIRPPSHLGVLSFKDLPTYPGSLGRYAGETLYIPVLTVELSSAVRMPAELEWRQIWVDIVAWLRQTMELKNPTTPKQGKTTSPNH